MKNIIRMVEKMAKYNLSPEWKYQSKRWGHSLHTMCSYFASFPPGIPHYFIEKFTERGETVFDPFSGRGTAPLEACILDREGIGNDLNPLAYVLTKSKVNVPPKSDLFERIDTLKEEWGRNKGDLPLECVSEKIKTIFHKYTLNQLRFLKEKLEWNGGPLDSFITGALLGILHGQSKIYLSVPMPNTYSMSYNYIKNYIEEHNLKKPKRDTFKNLKIKIKRLLADGRPTKKGMAYQTDARSLPLESNSVKLIVSSPPYLKVIKYGMYNWIRLWFLGKDEEKVDEELMQTSSLGKYLSFMRESLEETFRVLQNDGIAVFVIGDVSKGENKIIRLARKVWKKAAEPIGFNLLKVMEDRIKEEEKTSKLWGEKRGEATEIDRLLIMYKEQKPKVVNKVVNWSIHPVEQRLTRFS